MANKKVAVAYIPVLHQGYLEFVGSLAQEGVTELYLVSDDILQSHEDLDYINRKDRLRAVPHAVMLNVIGELTTLPVLSLTLPAILALHEERVGIVTPKEDINLFVVETYFGGHTVSYKNIFLRWNKENLGEENEPKGEKISWSIFEQETITQMLAEAEKSADWWRQVGAAIVKDGKVLALAHNEHMPEKELPNIEGDTRSLFKKGVNIHYVTTAHAEASAVAQAAKMGLSTEGATLFTTDFPCPYCARIISKSGIKKIYYMKGYAVLGGDDFFRDMGIEVVKIAATE
jgi:dCMP deaminase